MGTIMGLFESREAAKHAIDELCRAGFRESDMSLLMRGHHEMLGVESQDSGVVAERDLNHGGVLGVVSGGLVGGLAGLALAFSAFVIPGLGPVLAAGPLATVFVGGAVGMATGGVVGSLIDRGASEEDAHTYQAGLERGGVILMIDAPDGREAEADSILQRSGMRSPDEHRRRWEADPNYRYEDASTYVV